MKNEAGPRCDSEQGASVVITHRVRDGQQAGYDDWLNEIGPICRGSAGLLDLQIIRPIAGLTTRYTVIIRFDTRAHLQNWMNSAERRRLIDKVRPLLAQDDDYHILGGLDFWFTPEGAKAGVPVRWKQFLVTWSAIYPLVLGVTVILTPLLHALGMPPNPYIETLAVSAVVVSLMVYLVMPHYTKLIHRWLYR